MRRLAVLAAALGALGEGRAHAGSCSGDSGGGGSSSSGSSSSGSSSSSGGDSSSSSTPACVETSDVLGRRQCSVFGAWAMPRILPTLSVEMGTSVRTIATGRLAFTGTVDHGDMGSYRFSMRGRPSRRTDATVVGADMRTTFGRRFYGGLELTIGGVSADDSALAMTIDTGGAAATARPDLKMYVGTGALAGVRVHLGAITLAAEAFGGVRTITTRVDSEFGACQTTATAHDVSASVELRARADLWVSPWVTLGAFVGQDVRLPETRVYGLYFGGHSRAFDGSR